MQFGLLLSTRSGPSATRFFVVLREIQSTVRKQNFTGQIVGLNKRSSQATQSSLKLQGQTCCRSSIVNMLSLFKSFLRMTTLANRPNTALVVIDFQNGVVANAYRRSEVLAAVSRLIERARIAQVPVVWVQHSDESLKPGSEAWQIVAQVAPLAGETIVRKSYRDAFEDTDLEQVLSRLKVGSLLVTGAQTDMCVRSTLHGALTRGYDVTLVSDAHTTEDMTSKGAPPPDAVISHTNMYWKNQRAPGRAGGVIESKDVDFAHPVF